MRRIDEALATLRAWAKAGGTFEAAPAQDNEAEILAAPTPEYGAIPAWKLPPSYRAYLALHARLFIKWGEDTGHDEFIVLSPEEIAEVSGVVYLPEGVSRTPGRDLSTNHLVPFASAGNDECTFCFDVTQAAADGEYPVYFHHQDEPRARYEQGGDWEDPDNAQPDFPSFGHWLAWVAEELAHGREPACSHPTAYLEMPGRSA